MTLSGILVFVTWCLSLLEKKQVYAFGSACKPHRGLMMTFAAPLRRFSIAGQQLTGLRFRALQSSASLPAGFAREGPEFHEHLHLALEHPTRRVKLAELGNNQAYTSSLVTDFAQSGAFRVLSTEGIATLSQEIDRLERFAVESPRIPRVLRGGSMRSRFIHGLCHSKALAVHMSEMAQTELIPHPMEIMNGHINFAPADHTLTVDRWHRDTVQFVFVLFCTPPEEYEGGEFEFFVGTIAEAEALLRTGDVLPRNRCKLIGRQETGFAVLQQGSEVYHRVRPVRKGRKRTTFVQPFVPTNLGREPCNRLSDTYNGVDSLECLLPDWARYRCWRALRLCECWLQEHRLAATQEANVVQITAEKLSNVVETLPYTSDRHALADALNSSVAELRLHVSTSHSSIKHGCHNGSSAALLADALGTIDTAVHDVLTLRETTMTYF